ncbi:MAG: D-alanine--D-alanine ligase family protein [Nannocystaceae bacterium]
MASLTVGILVSRDLQRSSVDTSGCDLASGVAVAEALCELGHRPRMIYVDENLDLALRAGPLNAAFVCLHGVLGTQGGVQAALELRGIPVYGPESASAALAFDKSRARKALAFHNLPVPTSVDLIAGQDADARALGMLGWPCIIKPRRGAHGIGVTRVESPREVYAAIDHAMAIDESIIVERSMVGDEVQVILIDHEVLGMASISRSRGTFAYPAALDRGRQDSIARLATRAAEVLGLSDAPCRVDLLVDPEGNEYILEVEPLPPMHPDGTLQRMLRAEGIPFTDFIGAALDSLQLATSDIAQPSFSPLALH